MREHFCFEIRKRKTIFTFSSISTFARETPKFGLTRDVCYLLGLQFLEQKSMIIREKQVIQYRCLDGFPVLNCITPPLFLIARSHLATSWFFPHLFLASRISCAFTFPLIATAYTIIIYNRPNVRRNCDVACLEAIFRKGRSSSNNSHRPRASNQFNIIRKVATPFADWDCY